MALRSDGSNWRMCCDRRRVQTPAGGDQCDQKIFTSGNKPRKRRQAAQRGRPPWRRADPRDMNKLYQRLAIARMPQCPPVCIVAKIRPGIARQPRRQRILAQHVEESRKRRVPFQCVMLSKLDHCVLRVIALHIGKQDRALIAGARLDANLAPPAGKTEHQDDVRLARQQFGQIAVDRAVCRRKDVTCDFDPGERRAAPARQRDCQTAAWIRRCPREWTKACDHDPHSITAPASPRSSPPRRTAPAGRRRRRLRFAAERISKRGRSAAVRTIAPPAWSTSI
jgi:hypothetical protein